MRVAKIHGQGKQKRGRGERRWHQYLTIRVSLICLIAISHSFSHPSGSHLPACSLAHLPTTLSPIASYLDLPTQPPTNISPKHAPTPRINPFTRPASHERKTDPHQRNHNTSPSASENVTRRSLPQNSTSATMRSLVFLSVSRQHGVTQGSVFSEGLQKGERWETTEKRA